MYVKNLYLLFWMSHAMFVEAAFVNELIRHIFQLDFYLVGLVRFLSNVFLSALNEEFGLGFFKGFCCSFQGFCLSLHFFRI